MQQYRSVVASHFLAEQGLAKNTKRRPPDGGRLFYEGATDPRYSMTGDSIMTVTMRQ